MIAPRMKCLAINRTKYTPDLYTENYNSLIKRSNEEYLSKWKPLLCSQILNILFQFTHRFSTTANNISASCCAAIDKLILKLIERQKAARAKAILEEKPTQE